MTSKPISELAVLCVPQNQPKAMKPVPGETVKPLTRLELETEWGWQTGLGAAVFRQAMAMNGGRPALVSPSLWKKACGGDVSALAEANRTDPGCILLNDLILTRIVAKTAAAVYGATVQEVEGAKRWLNHVLVPTATYAGRGIIGPRQMRLFPLVYKDVLVIRAIHERLARKRNPLAMKQLLEVLPDLRHLRPTWAEWIFGRKAALKGKKRMRPVEAAELILGDAIGYKRTVIRQKVKALQICNTAKVKLDAARAARAIVASLKHP